ncbi:MAG: serine hydrolase [Pseudonocardiaceae bacterium]
MDASDSSTASERTQAAGGTPGRRIPGSLSDCAQSRLEGRAAAAVAAVSAATAEVAVAVADRSTGEVAVSPDAAASVFAASLVKLLVAVDVLDRRRSGLAVSDRDVMLIERALGPSDDEAMNELWVRFDGLGAVQRVARRLGLTETRPPADPSQWGEALTSAPDVLALYQYVLGTMAAADRELIMGSLGAAPATATDGREQTFGLLARGPSPAVAAKQGWMCCQGGQITLHSAGTVDRSRRFVIVLLSTQPRSVGYDGAARALTAAADAARAALS